MVPIQSVFHRNIENGHPRLVDMGLESDRLPRSAAIYYV